MGIIKVKMIGTISTTLGISMYCEELAKHLAKRVELSFVEFNQLYPLFLSSLVGGRTEQEREYSEAGFQVEKSLSFSKPWTWLRPFREANECILHLQWWSPLLLHVFLVLGLVARFSGRKVITTIHNVYHHDHRLLGTLANKIIFRISNYLIVHGENNRGVLLSDFGIPESRVFVIPHGLLGGRLTSSKKSWTNAEVRKKLNISETGDIVLFVGHIRKYKGLDSLIRAFSLVIKNHPDAILLIAGKPWGDWEEYVELIHELEIDQNVRTILDYIPDTYLQTLFDLANMVVLPYRSFDSQSGIGLMSLEHAKAMIVSETGGLPDLVEHPISLVQPGNVGQLSKSISSILNNDALQRELENTSRRIRIKYRWDNIAKKTVRAYKLAILSSASERCDHV